MIQNDMADALDTFSNTFTEYLQTKYETKSLSRQSLVTRLEDIS